MVKNSKIGFNNCGGNKKAGLPSLTGYSGHLHRHVKTECYPNPKDPFVISSTNTLSGVARRISSGVNTNALNRMRIKCDAANGSKQSVVIKPYRSN